MLPTLNTCQVAVIGLGYVGLPLAVEFAKLQTCCRTGEKLQRRVIGFDINIERLAELQNGVDRTNETSAESQICTPEFTSDPALLAEADVFIVTVLTPIDSSGQISLVREGKCNSRKSLKLRSERILNSDQSSITPLVLTSTVYPGARRSLCSDSRAASGQLSTVIFSALTARAHQPRRYRASVTTITKVTSGS